MSDLIQASRADNLKLIRALLPPAIEYVRTYKQQHIFGDAGFCLYENCIGILMHAGAIFDANLNLPPDIKKYIQEWCNE
jgi:hypothetical protein